MGQLWQKGRPKRPQESQNETPNRPKTAKMRLKGVPREPKYAKKQPQNLHIANPSLTRPAYTKPVTHQTGDPPFLDLKGEASKAATKRRPRAAKRRTKDTQERPRDAQERPRGGQERPKNAQNTLGRLPDPSKNGPGTPQDASWARFSQEPLFERLWDPIFD